MSPETNGHNDAIRGYGPAYEGDALCLGSVKAGSLAASYGTPLYVVEPAQLVHRLRMIEEGFSDAGLPPKVFFSVKTNPLPFVLKTLMQAGAGAEVLSEDEYVLVRRIGFDAERIVVNGPAKSEALLRRVASDGVALVNVESFDELLLLRDLAREARREVAVGLRVNPGFATWKFDPARITAAAGSAMGFRIGGREFAAALALLADDDWLRFRGLHLHIGSGIDRPAPFARALDRALHAAEAVVQAGLSLEVFDLGGGLGVSTIRGVRIRDLVRPNAGQPVRDLPGRRDDDRLIRDVARAYAFRLVGFAERTALPVPRIYLEPGRAVSGPAQHLLLTVRRIASASSGRSVAFCDRGGLSLSPMMFGERHEIVAATRRPGPLRQYRLVGNLPTPLDLISRAIELPELRVGDVLAVLHVGAYFTSLGNTFGGPRPGVVSVESGEARMVRRAETLDDLIQRDEVDDIPRPCALGCPQQ